MRGEGGRAARGESGAGTVLVAAVAIVVVLTALVVVVVGAFVQARHVAEGAADLAAVDGARAMDAGGDGCSAARGTARANGGRLTSCDTVGDGTEFAISVEVTVHVGVSVPGLPRQLSVRAEAGRLAGAG